MNDLPPGWEATTIGEIADVGLGRQRSPKNHTGDHMRPYLRSANVTWDGIDLTDVKEMNFDPDDAKKFELQPGDLLLNEASGSPNEVGKPAIWNNEIPGACFQNTLLRVQTRGPLTKFLYWYCHRSALLGEFGEAGRGVNIRHLGKRGLADFPIPLPPLAEQERIVAALEEQFSHLDAAEASLHRAQHNLDRFREAILAEAFDSEWTCRPLEEITDPGRPVQYGILKPGENVAGGVPVVKVRDYPKGTILVDGLKRTSREIADKYRRASLAAGDVLISIRGTYGRVTQVPDELEGGNITQDSARIAPGPEIDRDFLTHFLRSPEAQRYFARVARGVAVKGVNIGDLRKLPVPVPDLETQTASTETIDDTLSLLDHMRIELDQAATRSSRLRRATLAAAFSGQLVPQDPADEPASVLLDRIRAQAPAKKKSTRKKKSA